MVQNIAIACDAQSGILALDVDPRNGGDAELAKLIAEHGPLPRTPHQFTGGGGDHYLFKRPLGVAFRAQLCPGVDVKANGYIIAAPSKCGCHPEPYRWDPAADFRTPLATLPDWIYARIVKPSVEHDGPTGSAANSLLGRAFQRAGRVLGPIYFADGRIDPTRLAVQCPWEDQHTSKGAKSSTIIFGPKPGSDMGWFHCSHTSHGTKTVNDVRDAIGPEAFEDPRTGDWHEAGVDEIFAELQPIDHVIELLDLAPGAPAIWGGYGYSGKTVAAQSAAISLAAGRPVWKSIIGRARACRTLHIDYEQGARLTYQRYQRLAVGMNVQMEQLRGLLTVVSIPGSAFYLDAPNFEQHLRDRLAEYDLCVIDSLHAACPTIEENEASGRRYLDTLTRVSLATNCTMLVIHHARKTSAQNGGGKKQSLRGSGALFDAASSVLLFEAEGPGPVSITHVKARNTGKTADPFLLKITDTSDPRPGDGPFTAAGRDGLCVSTGSIQEDQERKVVGERARDRERLLDTIRQMRGAATSRNELCKMAGLRKDAGLGELARLIIEGAVLERPSDQHPKLKTFSVIVK